MDTTIEITEKEYLEQYVALNLHYRRVICEACLMSFNSGNDAIQKSLGTEILYQYIGMLEDLLMVYFALKDRNNRGSVINGLLEINIKEGSNYSTEALIRDIEGINSTNITEFLKILNLPNEDEILDILTLTEDERQNPKKLKQRYVKEIIDAFTMLKHVISNRIKTNDGEELPLYKVANKIKHGSVMVHNYRGNKDVFMPFKVLEISEDIIKLNGYYIHFQNKKSLVKLKDNMNKISEVISSLLNIYLAFNYKELKDKRERA